MPATNSENIDPGDLTLPLLLLIGCYTVNVLVWLEGGGDLALLRRSRDYARVHRP